MPGHPLFNIPQRYKAFVRLNDDILEALQKYVEREGINYAELAKRLNKRKKTINRWFSGEHNFTIKHLALIEEKLNQPNFYTINSLQDKLNKNK